MTGPKKSRCAFVLIKVLIDDTPFLLMRQNEPWNDVNFIGGHETDRDAGNLRTCARRELLEELPALRGWKSFDLVPLTAELAYGPVESRSAKRPVQYELQFFLVKFGAAPEGLARAANRRSANIFVPQDEVLAARQYRISGLVRVLDSALAGGIRSTPLSWAEDVGPLTRPVPQKELRLQWKVRRPTRLG